MKKETKQLIVKSIDGIIYVNKIEVDEKTSMNMILKELFENEKIKIDHYFSGNNSICKVGNLESKIIYSFTETQSKNIDVVIQKLIDNIEMVNKFLEEVKKSNQVKQLVVVTNSL